jgi:hypothetical protein
MRSQGKGEAMNAIADRVQNIVSEKKPSQAAGEIELRQRDGSTVVARAKYEMPPGAIFPDVVTFNKRLYHLICRGAKSIFVESVLFELSSPNQ